jgi:hypothetical protein
MSEIIDRTLEYLAPGDRTIAMTVASERFSKSS